MIPIQTIRGAVICFDVIKEEQRPTFTAVVSAWRRGLCLASEKIKGCSEEDPDDFWRNERGGLKDKGPFFDALQVVLAEAESTGMVSKERREGAKPFSLLAEFIYLDDLGYLRWCPRSEAMRKDANYTGYDKFDEFVNAKFAHAIVAAPEFTFMGEKYEYDDLHRYLTEKRRKNRDRAVD